MKQLTGGDTITARYLYCESFEFRPQFKLWSADNDRPYVRADDGGVWRRIVHIPFTCPIPDADQDPSLKQRLRSDV